MDPTHPVNKFILLYFTPIWPYKYFRLAENVGWVQKEPYLLPKTADGCAWLVSVMRGNGIKCTERVTHVLQYTTWALYPHFVTLDKEMMQNVNWGMIAHKLPTTLMSVSRPTRGICGDDPCK